jgi:hypothetical protein
MPFPVEPFLTTGEFAWNVCRSPGQYESKYLFESMPVGMMYNKFKSRVLW